MLRSLSFRGIPSDVKGLRPIVWKLLFGYLPLRTSEWEQTRTEAKKFYDQYVTEFIIKPDFDEDHPLSISKGSKWHKYFGD
jgi:hypothetical protein